jgi:hypothetical protein
MAFIVIFPEFLRPGTLVFDLKNFLEFDGKALSRSGFGRARPDERRDGHQLAQF